MTQATAKPYSGFQLSALVALRLLIGWHFFYEGLAKLVNPYWSSAEFIDRANWLFAGVFRSIAASPGAVTVVDALNVWGLMAIGLGLIGMALGFVMARLLRQDNNRSRTIALETGIQNGPLAVLIVTLSIAPATRCSSSPSTGTASTMSSSAFATTHKPAASKEWPTLWTRSPSTATSSITTPRGGSIMYNYTA